MFDLMKLVDRNILCYDCDAKPGELTANLFAVMTTAYTRNTPGLEYLDKFLDDDIQKDIPIDIHPIVGWKLDTIYIPKCLLQYHTALTYLVRNHSPIEVTTLKDDFLTEYLNKNYHLAKDDRYLVIGWDSIHDNGILGSC